MKKFFILALSAAFAAFSCSMEISIDQQPESLSVTTQTRTFTMEFAPSTKVSINGEGKTRWVEGDQIMVHGEYMNKTGYSVIVTLDGVTNTISPDGKTATITITTGTGTEEGTVKPYVHTSGTPAVQDYTSTLYALYPASAATDGEHRSYYNTQFKTTNEPLMLAYDNGEGKFIFKNLCSVITFTIPDLDDNPETNDFDHYIFSGNNDEAVSYTSYAAVYAMYTSGSVKDRQGGNYDSSKTSGSSTSISGPVVCDGTTLNKIFIPGAMGAPSSGVTFSKGFTIELVKDGVVTHKVSTKNSISLAVNDYLPLGDISSHIKAYSRTHSSELSSDTDLSTAKGSANCYVVAKDVAANAGKVFKFPHVRGNSATSVGQVADVVVLWSTKNNNTAPGVNEIIKAVDYDATYVYFEMPNPIVAGNAVIAAKNVIGEILWSWHIWVPSTSFSSSTYGVSSVPMMDRNLGALVIADGDADTDIALESCGLFYQWGRKDPFPGPGSLPNDYTTSAAVSGTVDTRPATSSAEIYKYPNSFVETGPESESTKDWSTDHLSSLWGGEKNENDPCPPGWKLPIFSGSEAGDIWNTSTDPKTTLPGYALNTTHHWLKVGVAYDDLKPTTTGYTYFPLAGYRTQDNSDYAYAGKRALIWQAYGESGVYAKCLYSDGGFVGYRTERKGRAGNVRCVLIPEP